MIESYNDNPTVSNINLYYDKIIELKNKYQISDILSKIALANSAPQLTSHNERELEKIKNNNLKIENDAKTKAETIKTSNNKIASTLDDLNSSIDKETMANRKSQEVLKAVKETKNKTTESATKIAKIK